jgi:hypothetical protein
VFGFRLHDRHVGFTVKLGEAFGTDVQGERAPPLREQGAGVNAGAAADVENAFGGGGRALAQKSEDQLTPSCEPEMLPFDLL